MDWYFWEHDARVSKEDRKLLHKDVETTGQWSLLKMPDGSYKRIAPSEMEAGEFYLVGGPTTNAKN